MNVNYILLILLLITLIISDSNETDMLSDHFRSEFGNKFMDKVLGSEDTKKPDSNGGSSRDINIVSESNPPITILREIVKPKRDGDFFRNEPIEVLVKIAVQKEGGLKQIEFWEDPGTDLDIINCSSPIRTSSIRQMRDYEERDQSLLRINDIININSIVNLLLNSSNNRNTLVGHVYKMLSNNTTYLLIKYNQSKSKETLSESLIKNLTIDFNKIITNNSINSLNRTLLIKDKIAVDRARIFSLNPGTFEYNESKDYCLQNRLILEHIFPNMLKNLSYIKKHEYLNLSRTNGELQILEKNLRQGEIIIFKYYLLPTGLGKRDIRYIVRADGYYDEAIESFNILERGEKFSIEYQCDSKEVILNQEKKFVYVIEYLGGADEKSKFPTIIAPPDGCNLIEASWDDKTKPGFKLEDEFLCSIENISFSKGRIEELSITVKYNKMGLKMSPPDIIIGDFPKRFEPDISVYADYDNPFRIHYEFYSIILTVSAIIISLIVAIFSSIEIFLTHREMMLTRKQIEQATSDKEESDRLMKKNLETFMPG